MSTTSWNSSSTRTTGAVALGGEAARQLQQPLERLVEVLARARRPRRRTRASRPRDRRSRWAPPAGRENTRSRSLARNSGVARSSWIVLASLAASAARDGVVIRSIWATSTLLGDQLLGDLPDQRRLAVPARREHDDVLAVVRVGEQLGHLCLAVGERLVQRERAEAERVDDGGHTPNIQNAITPLGVTLVGVTAGGASRAGRSAAHRGSRTSVRPRTAATAARPAGWSAGLSTLRQSSALRCVRTSSSAPGSG